jgi:hypothetical protein
VSKCSYDIAWVGCCKKETAAGQIMCDEHAKEKCISCGAAAIKQCDYTGQFVCGYPLCDDCEGWTDSTKPYGGWGFLNHSHRKKEPRP